MSAKSEFALWKRIILSQALLLVACSLAPTSVYAQFGCTPPMANPIVCENSYPGNSPSEWDISGVGDSSIQGFATDISVNQGQTVRFKVKTTASTYRIDIYRLGYYNGNGARKVATISNLGRQNQPACVVGPPDTSGNATGLLDCGNWAVSASWVVPANATSGIYIARLVRSDNGGASHALFIVRADSGGSQILFQTSDTTWTAYNTYSDGSNIYGGNNLYTGSTPAGRAYKVSYNRPYNNRGSGASAGAQYGCLFSAEYPMVRWLEANGYDVSYFTGVDSDRNGSLIRQHKVFISVGHDEYWSLAQRTNVETARANGVHLAFFSGNEVFWKTRWESSVDSSNTPYRTLVCYKETHANARIDPLDPPTWTGTWRDPRFSITPTQDGSPPADGGRPENALTGTIFYVNGVRSDSISVPAAYGRLRFWRNTAIATLAPGTSYSTPGGTLGYEWDQDLDNGFRPAGVLDMSFTPLDVSPLFLLDYGSTYGSGTSNHSLTLYRFPPYSAPGIGALVFGAGTVQWSWGLDGNHDNGGSTPDVNMQQATVNLLADMRVQPATLQTGLVPATASTNTTAPTSTITSPVAGANVQANNPITVTGTATDSGGGVVAGVEVSTDGGTTWHRVVGLGSWTYMWTPGPALGPVTLKSRAVNDSANLEVPSAGITVNVVADTTPPVISGVQASPVANTWATITWSTNKPSSTQVDYGPTSAYGFSTVLDPTLVTSHSATVSGLSPTTLYHYRVKSQDASNNLAISSDFTFTTTTINTPQNITFDAITNVNVPLNGQYPSGWIDWGTGMWYIGGPWGAFTNNSISFNGPGINSANFTFLGSWRLLSLDAYNGDTVAAMVTLSCPGQLNKQVTLTPGQLVTISTGWTDVCSPVTITTSDGWNVNFNNFWVDSPPSTPPVISGVQSTAITCSGATVIWNTDKLSTSQVDYGVTTAYGASTPLDIRYVTSHSVSLSGLTASTLYDYRVDSKSAAGVLATSGNFTFTTGPRDPNPPVISAVQAVAITNSNAYVTWTTDKLSTSQVDYGTTTSYGISTPLNATLVTSHSVPLTGLSPTTVYHFRVDSTDTCGNLTTSTDFNFTTTNLPASTIWTSTTTPTLASQSDTAAVEVGVKFQSDVAGYITGIRFYKGSLNTGTHVGNLWTSTGVSLASVTFTNETASGWQQVNFATPVAIAANTIYVASYHTNVGGYSDDRNYFATTGYDNPPLHALPSNISGGNGVYIYSSASAFPTQSVSSNYWVDVLFTTGTSVSVSVSVSPTSAGVPVGLTQQFTATVRNTTNTNVTWQVNGVAGGDATHGTISTAGLYTAPSTVPSPATVTVTAVSQADPTKSASASVTIGSAPSGPTISAVQAVAITNSSAYITWTTDQLSDSQVNYGPTSAYGNSTPVNSTLVTSHSVFLSGLAPTTLYHYQVKSKNNSGVLTASADFTFTTTSSPSLTIWSSTATPSVPSQTDTGAVELGVKFTSDVPGYITGLRFYKGSANTGTHVGNLWTIPGTLLASATFTNETATGWQQVNFATPVQIAANTTYVASYHTNVGGYSDDRGYFGTVGYDNPPLHALVNGANGGNGVYLYGASSGFPAQTYQSSNYWVDIAFVSR